MKTYELTYIISSQVNSAEIDIILKNIESFIQEQEGIILSPQSGIPFAGKSEKTSAKTLAYPIKKQSSGYFITLEFQALEDKIKEIKSKIEKDNKILRHFIIVKKPIKEMKERRIRKPLFMQNKIEKPSFANPSENRGKKSEGKVELEEIEKKLDEIFSE